MRETREIDTNYTDASSEGSLLDVITEMMNDSNKRSKEEEWLVSLGEKFCELGKDIPSLQREIYLLVGKSAEAAYKSDTIEALNKIDELVVDCAPWLIGPEITPKDIS